MREALILAGGLGRRLRDRLGEHLPKPLIGIGGRPLVEHQIELCRRHGISHIRLFIGHQAETIRQHLGDGSRFGVRLAFEVEKEPLGTAGAILAALTRLDDSFLVLYGDVMLNVDLQRMWAAHGRAGAGITLLVHPNDHPLDSDLVEVDRAGWIRAFHHRPHPPGSAYRNLVSAALYVVDRAALAWWLERAQTVSGTLDFGRDVFPGILEAGGKLWAYQSTEYIKDIGTPDRYDRVCAEYERGVVQRSGLDVPQTAVFLDRDGTLNREIDGLTRPEQLELLSGAAAAVRTLNHEGIRAVLVTNQPLVAKGLCAESDVESVHRELETLLGSEHAFLDRLYWCPHHPERGFAGERPELKMDCECRKPKPGMILAAARELNIDLGRSWLIGDSTTDLAAARNAGVRSVLVRTGHAGRDGKYAATPDFEFDNLTEAVDFIVTRQRIER